MANQRILSLVDFICGLAVYLPVRSSSGRWKTSWTLALGNSSLHGRSGNSFGESSACDQVRFRLRAPLGFAADSPPNSLWTKYAVMAIPGSMVIWMAVMPVYSIVAPKLGFSTEYFGIIGRLISSPVFWGMAVVLPCLCLMRDFAWKYVKRMYYPQTYHHIQEIQKYNIQDYRPRYVSCQKSRGVMLMTFVQDGTIPEGNKKSPPSTEDAETAWICVFTSRRGCNPVDPSLRHHEREGQVWGNAKCGCSIQMMINTKFTIFIFLALPPVLYCFCTLLTPLFVTLAYVLGRGICFVFIFLFSFFSSFVYLIILSSIGKHEFL